jgi:hypothetical protein
MWACPFEAGSVLRELPVLRCEHELKALMCAGLKGAAR